MKKRIKRWVHLVGALIAMFGFASCGSSQKSAGENPVQKQTNLNERLVGISDGSVYREVREVIALKLSPATPVGNLVPTTNPQILRDQKWNLYNFIDGVITSRAVPVYGWKRIERVSGPTKKRSTKTQSPDVSTKSIVTSQTAQPSLTKKVKVSESKPPAISKVEVSNDSKTTQTTPLESPAVTLHQTSVEQSKEFQGVEEKTSKKIREIGLAEDCFVR